MLHASELVVYDGRQEVARHERLIAKGQARLDLATTRSDGPRRRVAQRFDRRLDCETVRTKLTDLVAIVVQRAYRCKDREYLRVARAVDSEDLRGRLEAAARSDNQWARRHAGYVLWLLDRPEVPNTIHVWQNWIAAEARE